MKTNPVTKADIEASVLSVPPLARRADGAIDVNENRRLLAHLRSGGVRTFMYGGNANLYNMAPSEFGRLIEMLPTLAVDGDWFIPSVGSDFGKALDQIEMLRDHPYPTAMVLPHRFPAVPDGVATGLRRLADAYGRPIIAYVKDDGYIEAADLGRLAADGVICAIKYAVVRNKPEIDPYLEEILSVVDRSMVISGIGERPAIEHLTKFGLVCFTSGSVCVAPGLSMALLRAIRRGDHAEAHRLRALFIPLEDLRDGISPLRVLHEAVKFAGIAETGPLQPFLSNITEAAQLAAIKREAMNLLDAERRAATKAA
ncbi:MAG TPA: dihydrodipicolinate synthase family protein [Xanthobacteraceae bacterium]|jgi:dihydrodipicolinate synthase/N-acetylneuraminate lyase|nr:dihydrodipicolinate synthase family protein [Xanthobacteraceae bacterium]